VKEAGHVEPFLQVLVLKPFFELALATGRHVVEDRVNAGTREVISIVVARHESLPSLPCDYLKIDLPLVGHRVGASSGGAAKRAATANAPRAAGMTAALTAAVLGLDVLLEGLRSMPA